MAVSRRPCRGVSSRCSPGPAIRSSRGAPLIVMEAMKMEHTITAPGAGVVDQVLCATGDQVREGVELLRLRRNEP